MQEDGSNKKFIVSTFNNYKMIDGRIVMHQLAELECILNHFTQHNMHMYETIIVSSIIDRHRNISREVLNIKKYISLIILANIFV